MPGAPYPAAGSTNWYGTLKAYIDDVGAQTYDVTHAPYSAVGNGTTDNATAINAAITAANAAGGGAVLIPAATQPFATGSAIAMKDNVTLLIYGTVKALAAHAGVGIDVTNVSHVQILGPGTVDMNKAVTASSGGATPQHAISVSVTGTSTVAGVTIRDVTVQNSWQDGISFTSISGAKFTDVDIANVNVTATGTEGIDFRGIGDTAVAAGISTCQRIKVRGCTVTNPGTNGIRCRGVSDVTIAHNVVTDAGSSTGHGICMGAGSIGVNDDQATDFTVLGNKVRGFVAASQWGVVVSARCTRFEVAQNTVRSCTNGITLDVKDPNNVTTIIDADGSVTGNKVLACVGTSGGMRTNQAANLTLTGNVVRGCTGTGPGLAINNSVGLTVTGNTVTGGAADGIAVGIVGGVVAGTGGHTIKSNTSTGNAGSNYNLDPSVPVVSSVDANLADAAVAEVSVSNTATETQLYGVSVPGNLCQTGTSIRVTAALLVDNIATSGTLTLRLKWGGTGGVGLATVAIPSQAGALTGQKVWVDYIATIRAPGASGTAIAGGHIRSEFSALSGAIQAAAVTVNTTTDKVLSLTAAWATANVGNVVKLEIATAEPVKT